MKKNKLIDVKIGTEKEALWTNVRDEAKLLIKQSKNNQIIQEAILELAEEQIKEEQKI